MSKPRRIIHIITALYIALALLTVAGFTVQIIRALRVPITEENKLLYGIDAVFLFLSLLFALTVESEIYFDIRYFAGTRRTTYQTVLNVLSPLLLCASVSFALYATVIGFSVGLYDKCAPWLARAYLAARAVYLILRTRDAIKL